MKKLIFILLLFFTIGASAQNTVTLPGGTNPFILQPRYGGSLSDSLKTFWFNASPGGGYNQWYSGTYINKFFVRKSDSTRTPGYVTNTAFRDTLLAHGLFFSTQFAGGGTSINPIKLADTVKLAKQLQVNNGGLSIIGGGNFFGHNAAASMYFNYSAAGIGITTSDSSQHKLIITAGASLNHVYGNPWIFNNTAGHTAADVDSVYAMLRSDGSFVKVPYSSGGLSSSNIVINETPGGTINSSNTAFTLAFTPTTAVAIFRNGLLQTIGVDYTISGTSITYLYAPTTGDLLRAMYFK